MGQRAAIRSTVVAAVLALACRAAAQDPPRDTLVAPTKVVAPDTVVAPVAPRANVDSIYRPEELRGYLFGTFGPRPLARALVLAGFDQWRGRPVAYPPNGRGFADRLGSRYGQFVISHTLRFGFARAFDERTIRYQPCACGDSISRFRYALIAPLRVNTPTGRHLSMLYPVTEIASGILVTTMRSDGLHVRDGILNGLTGIAAESGMSLVREFWPWRWRPPFL